MSEANAYNEMLPQFEAIPKEALVVPDSPVDEFCQFSEDVCVAATRDKAELMERGLPEEKINILPFSISALRMAQANWFAERNIREEAMAEWKEKEPVAYELRDRLIAELDFAFYGDADLTQKITEIREGRSHADMIQDLVNLAVLGEKHPNLLAPINFDNTLLNKAKEISEEMSALLAAVNGDRFSSHEKKLMRDRAYTFTKELVDTIRRYGRFVFRNDPDKLESYRLK